MLRHLLILSAIILLTGCSAVTKDGDDILPPSEPTIYGIKEGKTYQQSVTIDVQKISGITYNASVNDFTYNLGTEYSYLGDHTFKLTAIKLSNGLTSGVTINFSITQNTTQQTTSIGLYGNLHAWSNKKGQAILVTNNCNADYIEGAWTGDVSSNIFDQVGTHTITISSPNIIWEFTPSDNNNTGFTSANIESQSLYLSEDKNYILGFDGLFIQASTGGFTDGTIIFKSQNPETFSKTITVYDSLLAPRNMTLTFERIAENQWDWIASGIGVGGSGSFNFNTLGKVQYINAYTVSMTGMNGSSSQTMILGLNNITQLYGTSNLNTYVYHY